MNLLNFSKRFPDEASCKAKWKEYRDKHGILCPHCGSQEHYWKKDKESYECKKCGYRQSLKANTVMHGSQLPFLYWFKNGIQLSVYTVRANEHPTFT